MARKNRVIAVDFDGTIGFGTWPTCIRGRGNRVLIDWLNRHKEMGDTVILWTCRENFGGKKYSDWPYKEEAIRFCADRGLSFEYVNVNAGETPEEAAMYSRKINADVYIDDRSIPINMEGRFWKLKWKLYLKLVDIFLDRMI